MQKRAHSRQTANVSQHENTEESTKFVVGQFQPLVGHPNRLRYSGTEFNSCTADADSPKGYIDTGQMSAGTVRATIRE